MAAGSKVRNACRSAWDAQTWDVDLACEINNDNCPGGSMTILRKGVKVTVYGSVSGRSRRDPVAPNDNNPARSTTPRR